MAVRQSEARVRQIAFWKKHQSILQNCADLSNMCEMKILVIMTLPDKVAEGMQQEFKWDDESVDSDSPSSTPERGSEKNIHTHFTHGTTIVFDSFSDEQDVRRRNLAAINISKINDTRKRFETDFTVRVSGKVTAVLGASTVANYRVVDLKRGHRSTPSIPSFSSVISNGAASSMAQSDKELASSLAACASVHDEARTDQLRKRCRTMLQQRYVHQGTAPISMVNPKTNCTLRLKKDDDAPGVTMPFYSATATISSFFAPVLRPVAVQQALSHIKSEPGGGVDHDGQLVDSGSSAVTTCAEQRRLAFAAPTNVSSQDASMYYGMGDKSHLCNPPAATSATAAGASAPLSAMQLPKLCPAAGADVNQQSAFSIFIGGGGGGQRPIILPPLTSDSHRLSSSDLTLTTMACPVPVNGLMNLADICFHRSSDEIITLSAAW